LTTESNGIPVIQDVTKILTPTGYVNVENLRIGDQVLTDKNKRSAIMYIYHQTKIGNDRSYPYIIEKNSIQKNYPTERVMMSENHLIKYLDYWILPKMFNFKRKILPEVEYYNIGLKSYDDNLVLGGNLIVESMVIDKKNIIDYFNRIKNSKGKVNILTKIKGPTRNTNKRR
jgi:hypothetical protein